MTMQRLEVSKDFERKDEEEGSRRLHESTLNGEHDVERSGVDNMNSEDFLQNMNFLTSGRGLEDSGSITNSYEVHMNDSNFNYNQQRIANNQNSFLMRPRLDRINTVGSDGLGPNQFQFMNLTPIAPQVSHSFNINSQYSLNSQILPFDHPDVFEAFSNFSFPPYFCEEVDGNALKMNLHTPRSAGDPAVVPLSLDEKQTVVKHERKKRRTESTSSSSGLVGNRDRATSIEYGELVKAESIAETQVKTRNNGSLRRQSATVDSYSLLDGSSDDEEFCVYREEDDDEYAPDENTKRRRKSGSAHNKELEKLLATIGEPIKRDKRLYIRKAGLSKDQLAEVEKFRKVQKRERNRILAAESRLRKKQKLEGAMKEIDGLRKQLAMAEKEVVSLKRENAELRRRPVG